MNPSVDHGSAYIIIGDSFASGAYLLFIEADPEIYFGRLTIPGCRLIPSSKIKNKVCSELFESTLNSQIVKERYKGVVIASNWLYNDMKILDEIIAGIQAANKEIILLGQRIRFDTRFPEFVLSSLSVAEASKKANARILPHQYKLNKAMKKRFSDNTKFIDLISLQCPDECDIFTKDKKIYIWIMLIFH